MHLTLPSFFQVALFESAEWHYPTSTRQAHSAARAVRKEDHSMMTIVPNLYLLILTDYPSN